MDRLSMGEKIKMLRIQNNLTLEQVGQKVGVGKSTVRKWETGMIANMRRDKIYALAEALHTTPAYLMGWEDLPATDASPVAIPSDEMNLSDHEKTVISAYRNHPEMQGAVDRLLGVEREGADIAKDMCNTIRAGSSLKKNTTSK